MPPVLIHSQTTSDGRPVKPGAKSKQPRKGKTGRLAECCLLLFLFLCTGAGLVLAQATEGLDRGQSTYRKHCMECHGPTGKGDGVRAPSLSPRPGNLVSAATSVKTDQELLRTIAEGKSRTAMPAWEGVLSPEDQQAVLQYIRSLVRFSRPPALPSSVP